MSQEQKFLGIILKKQAYVEADEIVTCFTLQKGKVRLFAKSVKLPKSKLQHALQIPFLVELKVMEGKAGSFKVIGAEIKNTFSNLRNSINLSNFVFFAMEAVLKFTPDEQKNEDLFFALEHYLNAINKNVDELDCYKELLKFKIKFLAALGFTISSPDSVSKTEGYGFSNSLGGFTQQKSFDFRSVSNSHVELFLDLVKDKNILQNHEDEIKELNQLLSSFIYFHLERELNSEKNLI